MCGIAGILSFSPSGAVDGPLVRAMTDAMVHRGPDGEGLWLSDDRRVGLGHRRLSIIDLSADAAQPMGDADGMVQVTFNGEIYNHLGLRAELEAKGHRFRTDHSDTEVLVHGYKEWGLEGLVERLEGMFAFALWDAGRKVLSLARDRIGIKPLYFSRQGGRFLFASEIKGILADAAVPRVPNQAALVHYLSFMVAPAPLTLFQGIFKMPAGHLMEVAADGAARAWRYWDALPTGGETGDEAHAGRDVLDLLQESIEKRMMSDVPFGVFLSGGIDSSANVALMSKVSTRPVKTFTVGFKDHTHLNELDYARKVADAFKTDHHEVLIDADDMRGYLDDLIHTQDEPIADWVCVPLYFVSKLAKDSGVTVVQVGEGSDEQFAGYDSYMTYLRLQDWLGRLPVKPFAGTLAPLAGMLRGLTPGRRSLFERAEEALTRLDKGQELFWTGANAFWSVHQRRYLAPGMQADPKDFETGVEGLDTAPLRSLDGGDVIAGFMRDLEAAAGSEAGDDLARMIHTEFRLRLPELLLMRVDKITMSTSVEGRVPFLDHKLVERTMRIGRNAKIDGYQPKMLLKAALRGVIPDEIIDRPKMGFAAPVSDWLRGDFGREAESRVLGCELFDQGPFETPYVRDRFRAHLDGREDNALHLWVLLNLAGWYDHWIDRRRAA